MRAETLERLHPAEEGRTIRLMCNLYAMMLARAEVAATARAMRDRNNNQPPQPGIYPDYAAPVIVVGEDGQREMRDMRWGLPTPPKYLEKEAAKRRDKQYIAKGKPFDWDELLKMEPDRGITNVRQTEIKHWQQWLGPKNRCLVPMTSFSEPDQVGGTLKPFWFALSPDKPLAFFAGAWTPHACVRKARVGWEACELYGFMTTEATEPVRTYHDKAQPVILTKPEEWDLWLSEAPWAEVKHLQRPLPEGSLVVVPPEAKTERETAATGSLL